MTPEQLAWVAGIIEGEGHIRANWVKHSRTPQLLVTVSMTDLDILQRLQLFTEMGSVKGPRQRGNNKPIWVWSVSKNTHAQALLLAILPWMSERRTAQIQGALTTWKEAHAANPKGGFCRRRLHTDEVDRGVDNRGHQFCKGCKRVREAPSLQAVI